MLLEPILPTLLSVRTIPRADPAVLATYGADPERHVSLGLVTCDQDDSLRVVHDTMREQQVRRIPVVDEGQRLIGLVTLNDLAREAYEGRTGAAAKRQRAVGKTFASICEPYENGAIEDEEEE